MAVVVNDFEVVPAAEPEPAAQAESHPAPADHASWGFRDGVERALRHRAERAERLRAD
jgi:hypothetical protein